MTIDIFDEAKYESSVWTTIARNHTERCSGVPIFCGQVLHLPYMLVVFAQNQAKC